jgi:hypothetical protein
MNERLRPLMSRLTDQTVLGQFLEPVERALERVRIAPGSFRVLGALDFLTLGVLRHIQAMGVMREQIQALLHLAPRADERAPLARSTWSDALSSPQRLHLTQAVRPRVLAEARALLPDRLAGIPGLGDRPVYALDGTYQAESAHYPRCTPRQGGEDNPKGHGLLSFYDLRLGCPQDVLVETRSRHETAVLKDYDRLPHAVTQVRRTVWVVDRGFIDAPFWDAKKATLGCTVITRMKRGLSIDSTEARGCNGISLSTCTVPPTPGGSSPTAAAVAGRWNFSPTTSPLSPASSPSSIRGAGKRKNASTPGRTTSHRPRPGPKAGWPSSSRCCWRC